MQISEIYFIKPQLLNSQFTFYKALAQNISESNMIEQNNYNNTK